MMQATIVPQYIDPPKPGKKNFSIKDTNNVRWSCPPALAEQFQRGQPVTVDYEISEFQGKSYQIVKGIAGSMTKPPTPPPTAPVVPQTGSRKAVDEEASMFAMGFLNRLYAGLGQFPGEVVLAEQVRACRNAWAAACAPVPKAVAETPPFDDDVPF